MTLQQRQDETLSNGMMTNKAIDDTTTFKQKINDIDNSIPRESIHGSSQYLNKLE